MCLVSVDVDVEIYSVIIEDGRKGSCDQDDQGEVCV